jgi:CubicO group peptidase (beta-lactamase class C family)
MRNTQIRSAAAVVALLCLLSTPALTRTAPDAFDGFDDYVESVMKDWHVPGLAVGAVKDGKVVFAKGYGYRDVSKQLPVTDKTLMAIGSNSKSFTVTLMGMLSDENKLDWERPVREYMPDFQLQDDVATRLMTPTDLVTHRSGLPRHDRMWAGTAFTRKDLFERLRFLPPSATFRQRYQYNNLMFMTAGVLVERITNESWDDRIKQRLFAPVGMTHSNTSVRDMPASPDYSFGYVSRNGKAVGVPFRNIDAVGPAGSINSNVADMLRYVQMHIDQGQVGGKQVISKRFSMLMQSMHSASPVTIDVDAPVYTEYGPSGYGLGVTVRSYRGHKLVDHGGSIDGFISAMSWMPHDRLGVVVLTNLSGTNPVPPVIMANVYDRLLELDQVDFRGRVKAANERSERQALEREKRRAAEQVTGTSPSRPLAQFAGTYEHPGYGVVTIAESEGRLVMTYARAPQTFEHFHYDVFQSVPGPNAPPSAPRTRISFTTTPAGKIDSVNIPMEPAVADIVFKRKAAGSSTSSY